MRGSCMGHEARPHLPSEQGPARTSRQVLGIALCNMICGCPRAAGCRLFGGAMSIYSPSQMRSTLHQMAAAYSSIGAQYTRVHHIDAECWRPTGRPMAASNCHREAERVVRASNRKRRSRSAFDRWAGTREARTRKCQDLGL
jgi:hypothetical protein